MVGKLQDALVGATENRTAQAAAIPRRPLQVLWTAGVLGGFGQSLAGAAGALLARQVTGSESVAGLPQACLVVGAATSALVLSRLTVHRGRRVALSTGTAVAMIGCLVITGAATRASFSLVLLGSLLLGAGGTAVMLGRYAAADLGPEHSRARLMASVLMATALGAVAGPNLLAPANALGAGLGLPALAGPYLVAAVAFGAAAGTLAVGLHPNATRRTTAPTADEPPVALAANITWSRAGLVGLAVLGLANLVMISVMTMAPVRMGDMGSGFPMIGLVVSLHIAGMYGPSPVSSWLTGRIGAARTAGCAAAVLIVACCLAAGGRSSVMLAGAMVLLGMGWNLGLLSGSTLLTAGVPSAQRPRREGRGEVAMGVAATGGGAVAGPVMAYGSYGALSAGAAVIATLIFLLLGARTETARPR